MRVHNPGPGEILDRLSILTLKSFYACKAGRGHSHFETESFELAALLGDFVEDGKHLTTCLTKLSEFFVLNQMIWENIDLLHFFDQDDKTYSEISKATVNLNDARAELISSTNQEFGVVRGKEKIIAGR